LPEDPAPRANAQSAVAKREPQRRPLALSASTPSKFLALVACLMLIALSTTACGTSGAKVSATSRTALALERTDLLLVTRALRGAEASVQREVAAARRVWPLIAHGVPAEISEPLQLKAETATTTASGIQAPSFMTQAEGPVLKPRRNLTGPAAGIAGLFQSFSVLSEHGWRLIVAAMQGIGHGSASTTRFLRADAPLYVASVYDGQFDLASIGKNLRKAYLKLGGSSGFSGSLRAYEVEKLATFYGDGLKLKPHSVNHSL
jgi:hypothetical protein